MPIYLVDDGYYTGTHMRVAVNFLLENFKGIHLTKIVLIQRVEEDKRKLVEMSDMSKKQQLAYREKRPDYAVFHTQVRVLLPWDP